MPVGSVRLDAASPYVLVRLHRVQHVADVLEVQAAVIGTKDKTRPPPGTIDKPHQELLRRSITIAHPSHHIRKYSVMGRAVMTIRKHGMQIVSFAEKT